MRLLVLSLAVLAIAAAAPKPKPVKLPKGPGQQVVQTKCSGCHVLSVVVAKRKSPDEWDMALDQMTSRGLRLTDDEYDLVSAYLVKNYGVK